MTIMVIGAHPDDEIIGAGGTLAHYAALGEKTIVVVFTKGEASHPWMTPEEVHKERLVECHGAAAVVGCRDVVFLEARDGKLKQDAEQEHILASLKKLILQHKPSKIFTHALDDQPYGHKYVHRAVMRVAKDIKFEYPAYDFTVWGYNIWTMNVRQRHVPKLVVDTSKYMYKKRKALSCFRSQKVALYQLIPFIYVQDFLNGVEYNTRYAETFSFML